MSPGWGSKGTGRQTVYWADKWEMTLFMVSSKETANTEEDGEGKQLKEEREKEKGRIKQTIKRERGRIDMVNDKK